MRSAIVAGDASRGRGARRRAAQPSMEGRALVAGVSTPEPYVYAEEGRPSVAVVDYGTKRSILRRLAGAGAAVTVLPARRRRGRARRLRRRRALERPRRSRRRSRRRPRVVRELLGRTPVLRDLPRPPAARRWPRATRRSSCRSATAARTTRCSSARSGRVLVTSPEPRLRGRAHRGRARRRTSRSTTARSRGSTSPTCARARCSSIRRRARARTTAGRCSRRWVEEMRVPRRTDIDSICLIGSGPIVIGQACEFDYAGCQALKVLREDGFRTIVVNSNPATIMTDPGFADRTYLEPLDLEGVADVLERERPDALLPTMGGQTALNLAMQLAEAGVLEQLGVELIGAADRRDPPRRGPRALPRGGAERAGCACRRSRIVTSLGRPRRRLAARRRPAGVHARRPRRRLRLDAGASSRAQVETGLRESPIGQVLVEESVRGWDEFELEVMRDKRDNVVDRLLDREPRPDGRAHGRLGHRRAADDALRRGVPGAARRGRRRHPRGRRRDRRLEHPVRARARDRRAARDRDEPARLALVRARVEGDGLPDREGRREARRRLHARRDPERPDEDDAGELRADARLRRRQVPALRVREVPRRRPHARHADEVGRRGDGDRPHVPRGVLEGDELARARRGRRHAVGPRRPPRGAPPVVRARSSV